MPELKTVLLIDDDDDTNYIHKAILKRGGFAKNVVAVTSADEAMDYLKQMETAETMPDLIFLDLNMPGKSGWDFLESYKKLPPASQANTIVYVLSTSMNPDDAVRAQQDDMVAGFESKLLDADKMNKLVGKYFAE